MRISDWSSDVCSSDLDAALRASAADCVLDDARHQALVESARLSGSDKINTVPTPQPQGDASPQAEVSEHVRKLVGKLDQWRGCMSYNARYFGEPIGLVKSTVADLARAVDPIYRSEEHTSELQSLMRISYAVFCLKKKT